MTAKPALDARRAGWDNATVLSSLITASAHNSPLATWLGPDRARRADLLHAATSSLIEETLRRGDVRMLADRSAVAVWTKRLRPIPSPDAASRHRQRKCTRRPQFAMC